MTGPASEGYLSTKQVDLLLQPIHPKRVTRRDDNGMAHVEGYDIRAELNRVFGFGRWDAEVTEQSMLCEKQVKTSKGGDAWNVVYRTRVRLTVKAPDGTLLSVQEATHVGESTHPSYGEAHGNAVTNSETYALRRCAINWGDQFGLSLYNKGSLAKVVRWTLVRPEAADQVDTDDVPDVNAEQDTGEGTEPEHTPAQRPAADLTGWHKRISSARDSLGLDQPRADLEQLRAQGELTAEEGAVITGWLDARAAEFDRATRQLSEDAGAEAEFVADFKARLARTLPSKATPLQIEVARAVRAKTITPQTANELSALIRARQEESNHADAA